MSKADIENLIKKYSSAANTAAANTSSNQSTSTTNAKFYDSTNTLTNDNQLNIGQPSGANASSDVPLVHNLNLTHVEMTCCEEYELVQNVITKLIKDAKKEKDLFIQASQPAQSIDENSAGSPFSSSKIIKSKFINTRRAKSPKSNATHIIQPDGPNTPINLASNPSIASSLNSANVISSSPVQSVNSQSLSNESSSSLNTNSPLVNSGEIEPFMNPSATAAIIKDAKKNSSKFPFFTKILNKANNNS